MPATTLRPCDDPPQVPESMRGEPTPKPRSSKDKALDRKAEQEAGARVVRAAFRKVGPARWGGSGVYGVEGSKPGTVHWVDLRPGSAQGCDCEDHGKYDWHCLHMLAARLHRGDDPRQVLRDAFAEARRELVRRAELKAARKAAGGR